MPDEPLTQQVVALRNMLSTLDARLAKTHTPPGGLEDLKRAVDSLRTSVWAILSASGSANYQASMDRFRLRRLIDFIRSVVSEMEAGTTSLHPEHGEVQILCQQLVERIGKLRPGKPN